MSLVEDLNDMVNEKATNLAALVKQRTELAETEAAFKTVYGGDDVQALLKRFAPKLAKWGAIFGLPTGGLAAAADTGAFSGVFDAIGKVLGLFGLG